MRDEDKAERLLKIMDQEDMLNVQNGKKPVYSTEDDFYELHPKYKIEIWRYHSITEVKTSNNINDILTWYKDEWQYAYDMGECCFEVYELDRKMVFDELNKLGFYE